ncbi:MAG TPA: chemotaxis protein CheW [Bacteroidales bacterium]|nr:chemotaxis protein CheW [Bacteroidales bacterium]
MKYTYLSFVIGEELYAVNVSKVLEVLEKQNISRVPNAPHYIKGIVNFRGDIVPVFESRDKFNLPERGDHSSYVIIVLDLSRDSEIFRIGAMVDRVKDVLEIDDRDIRAVPVMSKEFNSHFLHGIYKLQEKFILLLDVDKVFTEEEVNILSNVTEQE